MDFRSLTLLLFLLFFFQSRLLAAPIPSGSVGGTLLDKETQSPLDHVTVFVYKDRNTAPMKVTNTNELGVFAFTEMIPGKYRIEASFLGYTPYKDTVSVLANQETHLGNIVLAANTTFLKSIEVTGLRSTMKLDVDKKIFSVDQSIASAGASASDILQNIPSIEVDAEGSISLRSSSNVIVWINGKPSGLTSDNRAQVLEQMPAESIDRIEVITNPSAKFSSEGSAGIINIILKKDRKAGYYGSIQAGGSYPWGYNIGGNITYNSSKWDLYATIGHRNDSNNGGGYTNRETYTYDDLGNKLETAYQNSTTDRTLTHHGLFLRGGADYHFNEKHTLGLSVFSMDGNRSFDTDISYLYKDNSLATTKSRERHSLSDGGHNNTEIELDYQWEIGKEHNLHAVLSGGRREFPNESSYTQTERDALGNLLNSSYQKESGSSLGKELEFQLDYTKLFSERWKLEAGLKSTVGNMTSDDQIFNGTLSESSWIVPSTPFASNVFDYDEQIHAAYVTLTGKTTQKFGYQVGMRAEQTNVSFTTTDVLTNASTPRNKDYLKLFPTVFLNYTLAEGSDIQLNYSKRINRPRGRMLNAFANISDSTNIYRGNPDLDPEYSHSLELNFIKIWEQHTLSAAAYYRINEQIIQDIVYLENGTLYTQPKNATHSTASGMELVAKDKFFKNIETTTTLNLYQESMEGFTYRDEYYQGSDAFSWNVRMNGQWMLPKNFTGQVSGSYSAPRIVAQGKTKAAYSVDLGLRKSLMDRKFMVSLNVQDLFNSSKKESILQGSSFRQESSNQFHGRTLRLNVTWNFGNLKPKEKPDKENKRQDSSEGMDTDF
jgi:outer membrane receptor protein involved in Fe transport